MRQRFSRADRNDFFVIALFTVLVSVGFAGASYWAFDVRVAVVERRLANDATTRAATDPGTLPARNTLANEAMAAYARGSFWTAAVQTFVNAVTLLFLVITLYFTRRAALAAQASAGSARESNADTKSMIQLMKETARVELRPYVSLASVSTSEAVDGKHGNVCTVIFLFRNYGRSPAYNFKSTTYWGLETDLKSSIVPRNDKHVSTRADIMPGQEYLVTIIETTEPGLASVKAGTNNLLMKTEFSYESPFMDQPERTIRKAYFDGLRLARGVAGFMA